MGQLDAQHALQTGSFVSLRRGLDDGSFSSAELTELCIVQGDFAQSTCNAFISRNLDRARLAARAADDRLARGERNPVLGLPLTTKDLIHLRGERTTAGSKMLESFVAPFDSTALALLLSAGAVPIGKSNLDEFAMGSSNETSFYGAAKNPYDTTRVPGGSSGGSAIAVALRASPLALGTDTGGSIRQPASFCGITGLKPSYGRVSRYGVVAFASSLDQVGPMASDALGCAALLDVMAVADVHHDATSMRFTDERQILAQVQKMCDQPSLAGLRVGLPREFFEPQELAPAVKQAVLKLRDDLQSQGAHVVEVSLPHLQYSLPVYYLICASEASSNLERYSGIHFGHRAQGQHLKTLSDLICASRSEGFGVEVQRRIMLGTFALSHGFYDAYFKKAAQVRRLIQSDFVAAFKECDVLLGPTAPTTAFRLGEKSHDPLMMYLSDIFTLAVNLAGLPGLSMGVGWDAQKLPIGAQLIGPFGSDAHLLGVAAHYQRRHPETILGPST